jgi:hypothetical protein
VLCFYLGLKNKPWFGPAGSEMYAFSACINSLLQLSFEFHDPSIQLIHLKLSMKWGADTFSSLFILDVAT